MTLQSESELVERVFLRIGMAEADESLEQCLNKFLSPLILKLSSPHEEVRNKVLELLSHVSKRVKARPAIQLPVDALLSHLQDPQAGAFVTNFSLVYVRLGVPRLTPEHRAALLPSLLACIPGRPSAHQLSILGLCVPIFQDVKLPPTFGPEVARTQLGITPEVLPSLLPYLLNYLLVPYSSSGFPDSCPPALNPHDWNSLPKDSPTLEQDKMGILKLLGSGALPGPAIVPHLVVGSSDTRHSVANLAELEMKRFTDSSIWNDKQLVNKLFDMFLGSTPRKNTPIRPEYQRRPADIKLRLKLFPCFLRSNEASKQLSTQGIQVIFESMFGTVTNPKLQSMALQYVINICNSCSLDNLRIFAKVLFSGLLKVANTFSEEKLVGQAYVALGLLVSKQPTLICTDQSCNILGVVQNLFSKLETCGPELKLSLRECLNMCGKALCTSLPQDQLAMLETVVLSQWCSPFPAVRQAVVHYSHAVFPRPHIPSKYCLIMATSDGMEEIRKEAIKALQQSETSTKETEPDFVTLVTYIQDKFSGLASRDKLPIPQEAFLQMVHYLHQVLVSQAGLPDDLKTEKAHIDQAPYITRQLRSLLSNPASKQAVFYYLDFLSKILSLVSDARCCHYLLELVCGLPEMMSHCEPFLPQYQNMMVAAREEVRDVGAQLVAAVLCYGGKSDQLATLLQEYPTKMLEAKHGYLLALGFGASYQLRTDDGSLPPAWLSDAIDLIYTELGSSTPLLSSGACLAISEVARSGPLPLHRDTIVEKLAGLVASPKVAKKERPIVALGHLCIGDPQYGYRRSIMEHLVSKEISELPDLDTHFTVGEALTSAILGPAHPLARNKWTTEEAAFKPEPAQIQEEEVAWLLKQILEHISSPSSAVRQSAAVWLLVLLKRCGDLAPVRKELEAIQQGFLNLLADTNELAQDMASKGLGALYELSEESQKEQLVSFLVETLTSGRKFNVAVSDDTKLFKDDAMGKAPGGGSLTTYKELCALATDLNQPDLVYKFLHLSNHHSIWNSRKGAAFGFGSIASKAKDQLTPFLGQIVPKIYRYQFDPNMAIRESFGSIWSAVVPDPQKAAETYFHEIMEDLLSNLTNSQWRVRESSCLAVKELLRTHPLVDFKKYLVPLWQTLFRVMDDIKETVRKAAETTLTSLSNNCVKLCDSDSGGKDREEILALVIPCLVQSGLQSPVAEVKAIGLSSLMQISKKSGPLLKPHLPLLVQALLEALGSAESQALNYISLRQESQQAQEKLDSARISAYRSSPMMATLVHLVQYVDEDGLKELVPHLLDLLKSSVALGTKASCSYFVIQLVTHCSQELQPYTGKLMAAFMNGLNDRNIALKKAYASTIGHLVRVAKDSSIEKLLTRIQAWYFEKEDLRLVCGHTLQAIGRHSSDRLKDHAAKALPLAFFAMNNPDAKNEIQPWEEVWLEFTPGTETGLQLYQSEVVSLCQLGLEDQSWGVKRQAAVTLGVLAERRGPGLKEQAPQLLESLLQVLMSTRRIWDGKEYLLQALTKLVVKCMQDESYKDTVAKVAQFLLEECQKNKRPYREEAIRSLGLIAEASHVPVFSSLFDILQPLLLNKETSKEDRDSDEENRAASRMGFRSVCLKSLGQAWPSDDRNTQELMRADWCALLEKTFRSATWQLQLDVLSAATTTIARLELSSEYPNTTELLKVTQPLTSITAEALANKKYSALRLKALECATVLLTALREHGREDVFNQAKEALKGPSQQLSEDPVPQIKDKASQLAILCCK